MRTIQFIIFALFLWCSTTAAQQKIKNEITFGLTQGVNLSKVDFNPADKTVAYMPGYAGGISLTFMSDAHKGIKVEFNYSQRGWVSNLDSTQSYSRRINYLEVPFLSHFSIGNSRFNFIINLGPYVAYYLNETEKMEIIDSEREYYNKEIAKNFDFGLCGGIGPSLAIGRHKIGLEGRYYNSLINLFTASSEFQYFSTIQQVISVRVFYHYRIN